MCATIDPRQFNTPRAKSCAIVVSGWRDAASHGDARGFVKALLILRRISTLALTRRFESLFGGEMSSLDGEGTTLLNGTYLASAWRIGSRHASKKHCYRLTGDFGRKSDLQLDWFVF
jgi:hypothetical protein